MTTTTDPGGYPVGKSTRSWVDGDDQTAVDALPPAAEGLLDALRRQRWRWHVWWRVDGTGTPYVQVHAGQVTAKVLGVGGLDDAPAQLKAHWYARTTGLRWYDTLWHEAGGGWRLVSVRRAIALVDQNPSTKARRPQQRKEGT